MHALSATRSLKLIAAFEGAKGIATLAVLFGIADLLHHDARRLIVELIGHAGIHGRSSMSSLLLHYADLLPTTDLQQVFALGFAYAGLRFAEAYGLWRQRPWGLWLGTASGGLYIPFELFHAYRHPHLIGIVVCLLNVWLVGYLIYRLQRRIQSARHAATST